MTEPYRRSIRELVTRYEFEPELRDLYVEGARDWFVLDWFFRSTQCANAVVYSIETVDVPPDLLAQLGVFGNRGRVIELCGQLAVSLPPEARNVLGLIDRDDGDLLQVASPSRYLLATDFSCLECYALSERTLSKFCRLYLGKVVEADRISEILDILVEQFLLRVAKNAVAKSAPWIDEFTRFCALDDGKVTFDHATFVERLSHRSAGLLNRDALETKFLELRQKRPEDVRQVINGHHLVQMLSWFGHQIGVPAAAYNQIPLQRALLASVELEEWKSMPLFQNLERWAKT